MSRQSVRQSNDDAASSNSRVLRERRRPPKPAETGIYRRKSHQRQPDEPCIRLDHYLNIDDNDDPAIVDGGASAYGSVTSLSLPQTLFENRPGPVERLFQLLEHQFVEIACDCQERLKADARKSKNQRMKPAERATLKEAAQEGWEARQWLVRCGELAQEGNVVGEKQMVLLAAVLYVGRLAERLDVRRAEPLAAAGRASRRGARAAASKTNANGRKKNEERNAAWQQQINELVMKKGLSYSQAKKRVATEAGVSDETVDRGTTNPRPRNGGRHAKKSAP
ncbi:hypothetical protein [Lacipirellula limnantheis]|uniref:Uncharacterized protein n=1 Tax=Lacipirellula limnantheis TaxID=2528024 RepID=A0A517U1F0_9BACT|nr:hypothetical protein [Lacipirellula limnantheis]QDT74465.1 hypothetical protein I41_36620 [Lacipirellula limnantheis]